MLTFVCGAFGTSQGGKGPTLELNLLQPDKNNIFQQVDTHPYPKKANNN